MVEKNAADGTICLVYKTEEFSRDQDLERFPTAYRELSRAMMPRPLLTKTIEESGRIGFGRGPSWCSLVCWACFQ